MEEKTAHKMHLWLISFGFGAAMDHLKIRYNPESFQN